jgi:hypothetical protein
VDEETATELASIISDAVWKEMTRLGGVPQELWGHRDAVMLLLSASASSGILAGVEWARRNPV